MVKRRNCLTEQAAAVLLCLCALFAVSPLILAAAASLRSGLSVFADFYLWKPSLLHAMTNSILISFAASAGTIAVSVFAAYVFAKVKFRGRDFLFYLYIIVMMMPFQVTLLPQYIVSKRFELYDTPLALILPGIFAPFAVFLLAQIMKSVPDEVIEAVRLDTSSTFVVITRIVVPAAKPGIICAWVLSFTEQWNAVAEPLILLETRERFPLAVILNHASGDDVLCFAAVVMFAVIPLLLFALFEEEIMEGLGEYRLK